MEIKEMIEVLQAAERGEAIEYAWIAGTEWKTINDPVWAFNVHDYRIAPKKEMSLVEELRKWGGPGLCKQWDPDLLIRAANRIEELERDSITSMLNISTDELLVEIKRRTK